LGEKEEEGCAVLASAESDCHTIPGDDHPSGFYPVCDTPFNVSSKMNTAEVTINIPLVYNCRFRAPGTQRCRVNFQVQGSASVRYPDNPDHILRFYNRILRYQIPVAGHNYFKRIDSRFKQYLFNRSRAMHNNPFVPVRKDKFHGLTNRFVGRFLKHPASGMHITGRKYFLKKPKDRITLTIRIFDTPDEPIQVRKCEG
jgi:hypothetical protein